MEQQFSVTHRIDVEDIAFLIRGYIHAYHKAFPIPDVYIGTGKGAVPRPQGLYLGPGKDKTAFRIIGQEVIEMGSVVGCDYLLVALPIFLLHIETSLASLGLFAFAAVGIATLFAIVAWTFVAVMVVSVVAVVFMEAVIVIMTIVRLVAESIGGGAIVVAMEAAMALVITMLAMEIMPMRVMAETMIVVEATAEGRPGRPEAEARSMSLEHILLMALGKILRFRHDLGIVLLQGFHLLGCEVATQFSHELRRAEGDLPVLDIAGEYADIDRIAKVVFGLLGNVFDGQMTIVVEESILVYIFKRQEPFDAIVQLDEHAKVDKGYDEAVELLGDPGRHVLGTLKVIDRPFDCLGSTLIRRKIVAQVFQGIVAGLLVQRLVVKHEVMKGAMDDSIRITPNR